MNRYIFNIYILMMLISGSAVFCMKEKSEKSKGMFKYEEFCSCKDGGCFGECDRIKQLFLGYEEDQKRREFEIKKIIALSKILDKFVVNKPRKRTFVDTVFDWLEGKK